MDRRCAQCNRNLPRTSYTGNQFAKGNGFSRCASCVHGHDYDLADAVPSDSGRYNNASRAEFSFNALKHPFAEGAFRYVAKGRYTRGERAGQAAVTKWFKTGTVFEKDYFTLDIKAVDKALDIANRFNQLNIVDKPIKVNVPSVWTFDDDSDDEWSGSKTLSEPFINNYQKFNSNTGWTDTTRRWALIMQALSHFSYHVSGGMFVLCDIQGGIYQREVVLSDPVILSRNRDYGVTDLGPKGISSFFTTHDCNEYCRPHWTQPANPVRYFQPKMGTSMLRHTASDARSKPARTYQAALSTFAEEDSDDDYY